MALQGAGFHNSKIDATTTDHQCYGQSYRAGRVGKYRRWFFGFENVVKSENAWLTGSGVNKRFLCGFQKKKNCFGIISRHSHRNFTVPPRSSKCSRYCSTLLKTLKLNGFSFHFIYLDYRTTQIITPATHFHAFITFISLQN